MNKLNPLFFLFICICAVQNVSSQCSSTGAYNAATFSSQSFAGSSYSWSNPANALSADNAMATASAFVSVLSGQAEYLTAKNFGFNINPLAIICGIEVQVKKSGNNIGLFTSIQDNVIKLIKNGTVAGNNKASASNWTTTNTYYTYGSSNDLWGNTWVPADINSNNFGVAISAQLNGIIGLFPDAKVDHVAITVYYTIVVLPVKLLFFEAKEVNNKVEMHWQTASDDAVTFIIQRSENGSVWKNIGTVRRDSFIDEEPIPVAYYRLAIISTTGETKFSAVRKVVSVIDKQFTISPNPATDRITIWSEVKMQGEIVIYNAVGKIVKRQKHSSQGQSMEISNLQPGTYYLVWGNDTASQKTSVFVKKQ